MKLPYPYYCYNSNKNSRQFSTTILSLQKLSIQLYDVDKIVVQAFVQAKSDRMLAWQYVFRRAIFSFLCFN